MSKKCILKNEYSKKKKYCIKVVSIAIGALSIINYVPNTYYVYAYSNDIKSISLSNKNINKSNLNYSGYSVFIPNNYPKGLTIDPDKNHFTFLVFAARDNYNNSIKNIGEKKLLNTFAVSIDAKNKKDIYLTIFNDNGEKIGESQKISEGDNFEFSYYKDEKIILSKNSNGTIRALFRKENGLNNQDGQVLWPLGLEKNSQNAINITIPKVVFQHTHYLDQYGKKIIDDYIQEGLTGEKYTTAPIYIPGYKLIKEPINKDGTLNTWGGPGFVKIVQTSKPEYEIRQTVLNDEGDLKIEVINKSTGKVTAYYDKLKVGENVNMQLGSPNSTVEIVNNYKPQTRDITYVYAQIFGSVIAKFVDENGKEIKDSVIIKGDDTPVGTEYSAERPNEIVKDGVTYVFKEVKRGEGNAPANGKVEEGKHTVTFVYAPKEIEKTGSVIAKFVDENGKEIKDSVIIKGDDTPVGTEYSAERPNEIVKDGITYVFKEVKRGEGNAPANGKVEEGKHTVTFVYAPKEIEKTGSVIAKFVDENGKEIKDSVIIKGDDTPVGTEYSAERPNEIVKDGITYVFKEVKRGEGNAPANGKVEEGKHTVTFVYAPKEIEKTGSVIAKFVDENGKEIKDSVIIKGDDTPVGTEYSAERPNEIVKDGITYVFKEVKRGEGNAPANGKVEEGKHTVTFVYAPKEIEKTGSVIAKFVDENGKEIKDSVIIKGDDTPVGTEYSAERPNEIVKDGITYVFKEVKRGEGNAPANGKVEEGKHTVTFVYAPKEIEKTGSVIAKFVDENGKEIKDSVIIKGDDTPVGTEYSAERPNEIVKDGITYVFKEVKRGEGNAPANGKVEEGKHTVTFVYAPKEIEKTGSVIAKFVDENGKEIKDSVIIKGDDTPVGTEYSAERPNEIVKDGITYVFKEVKRGEGNAPANGKVEEGKHTVTFVYAPKEIEKTGSVIAKFVDENGKEIKDSVIIKGDDTPVGTEYSAERPNEIVKDGVTYVFKEVKRGEGNAPANGKVEEGKHTVTFVYTPKEDVENKYDIENNNLKNTNIDQKEIMKLPKTGDSGVLGYFSLFIISIIGLFFNKKK
ncbi:MucBP domain-containing protein (plasmid) [Clostridium perfringens]